MDLIADAGDDLPVYAEELSPYLESRGVPTAWLPGAYAKAIPGLAEAAADAALKSKQLTVLRSNHDRLVKAVSRDLVTPQLLDPSTVSAEEYVNPTGL
jgi:hypothetical protein